MPSRRVFLATACLAVLAGCTYDQRPGTGDGRPEGSVPSPTPTSTPTETREPTRTPTRTATPEPESRGPVRGESDVELSVTHREEDDHVEFVEEGETVRYVAGRRHVTHPSELEPGETPEWEPVFETTTWESWREARATRAAANAAADHVRNEIEVDHLEPYVGSTDESDGRVVTLTTETVLGRDGEEVVEAANVGFEDLVAVTPRTVDAAYVLEGREYTTAVPIFARHSVTRYQ